jgi:thioester reductase-like protein
VTLLLTGFPGFLASALLPRILERSGGDAVCLVQPHFATLARRRVEELSAARPSLGGRIRLVEGDITRPGLGLTDPSALLDAVREVWHLAAVYDLAVTRELGMRVNVDGTRNVLDVAARCEQLERLQYVSTCYVSGRYVGPFAEEDLQVGAPFNNFYEETKHLAEVDVRGRMAAGLPATIYRPSIVVGDSTTGETQKFDGPYYIAQLMLRQARVAVMPVVGDPRLTRFNVVPRDFVVAAIAHLSGLPQSLGVTYQLADPRPPTVAELIAALGVATRRRVVPVRVSRAVARRSLRHVPGAGRVLRIPVQTVDYLSHPTHYLTGNARRDLAGTGVEVPRFASYAERLVDFMRAHPEVGTAAMV